MLTKTELEKKIGREVDQISFLLARNEVLGTGVEQFAEVMGLRLEDLRELKLTDDYQEIYATIALDHNDMRTDTAFNWDMLEQQSLKNLAKKAPYIYDVDTNLRIAAVANKALRRGNDRNQNGVLDPSAAGSVVRIQLSERMIQKLTRGGEIESQERRRSITFSGDDLNPSFASLSEFLQQSHAKTEEEVRPRSDEEFPSFAEIAERLRHVKK